MQMSGKGSAFGKMQMVVGRGEKPRKWENLRDSPTERETWAGIGTCQSPFYSRWGGSKSSLPILFISQTLGDLWTGKASGLQPGLGGGGGPFH